MTSFRLAFAAAAAAFCFAFTAMSVLVTAKTKNGAASRAGSNLPVAAPKPTPTAATPTIPVSGLGRAVTLKPLAPLNLSDMKLFNWNGTWTASEWSNANSLIPWKYGHISQAKDETSFTLDAAGAPELQAMNATPSYTHGLWETDVTLPPLRDGLVVAPLWLYDPLSKDEVDFEFAGRKGLDVSLHGTLNGQLTSQTVRLFLERDMSGERHRFGVKVDEAFGYVEMYLDGERIYRWDKTNRAFIVTHPLKPWIEMWAANPSNTGYVSWVGKWAGMTAKDGPLVMVVHGYGYSKI